jgi:hypothetical protein
VSAGALAVTIGAYLIFHPHLVSVYHGSYVLERYREEEHLDRSCLERVQSHVSPSEMIQRLDEDQCTRTEMVPDGPPGDPVDLPEPYASEDECSRAIWSAYRVIPDETRIKKADCRQDSVIEWWWW